MQESRQPKARPAYSRRALAAYWLVKAAVELDRRGIRGALPDSCHVPGTDLAQWTERNHRCWQKKSSTEELLEMVRREWEKGQGGPHPVWPRKPTTKNVRGERPWMVGTNSTKATIMGRLRNAQPGTPGYSHFASDHQQSYFEQVPGEALVTTYSKGQPVHEWRPKKGVRHEALDAGVYAYAARGELVSMGLVLDIRSDLGAGHAGAR